MIEIKSKTNPNIQLLRKLSQKKYRIKFDKFFVENLKIIEDSEIDPEMLFAVDKKILEKSKAKNRFLITKELNKYFSELETPSGVAAIYKKIDKPIDFKSTTVYLNGINDPGNLGTILRSALAFGFKNVVVDEKCADIYNSKTINAAKDSIFKLNITRDKKLKVFNKLKNIMPIVSTSLKNGKKPEVFKGKKICLVLGSEAHGVDSFIQKTAKNFITIKMSGKMESLNVAVSAGVIFYGISK